MKTSIVTEGQLDQNVIETILQSQPGLRGKYKVYSAGASATSLARTLLATSDDRVVLIADSDSIDPDRISEKKGELAELLGAVGAPERYVILLQVP